MDQIHELLVASICYPAATFRCSLGSEQNGVLLSMSATAIAALLGAGEEEISAAQITGLIGDQIMAFQQTASHILGDLQAMWSDRDLGLRCLDVSASGPALTWSMEQDLTPAGFARAQSVVVIVGLQVTMEGVESEVINPASPANGHGSMPAIVLCYNLDVVKANAL